MIKFECDRCKKASSERKSVNSVNVMGHEDADGDRNTIRSYDLCGTCLTEFHRWIGSYVEVKAG